MSAGYEILGLKEEDVQKFLSCTTHIGAANVDSRMMQYVFRRKSDGVCIFNLRKTWEKLQLAARAIVAVENPADVCVISARPYGQRAILKFASYTGATAIAGRFTPGAFTNQIQAAFREPRLLIVTDPTADRQPITEAAYVNLPCIALCNTDNKLSYIDIAIPCNNRSIHSVGLMWWLLTREVLRLRGLLSRDVPWDVMPDLFFYRDPEESEKEDVPEPAIMLLGNNEYVPEYNADLAYPQEVADWGAEEPTAVTAAPAPAPVPIVYHQTEDWSAATDTSEWVQSTVSTHAIPEWGGGASDNWG